VTTATPELDRFHQVVAIVRREFPGLRVNVDADNSNVDAAAAIPAQAGLDFQVGINLQNDDELHLEVGRFSLQSFPCHRQDVFDRFVGALTGVLSGHLRILESHVLGMVVCSRLQSPTGDGKWQTIGWKAGPTALLPWPRRHRILQNRPGV
jgi:hypothetical protein